MPPPRVRARPRTAAPLPRRCRRYTHEPTINRSSPRRRPPRPSPHPHRRPGGPGIGCWCRRNAAPAARCPGRASARGRPAPSPKQQMYQCPMHPQIIQDHPGDCPICGMKLVPIQRGTTGAKDAAVEDHAAVTIDPERQQLIGLTDREGGRGHGGRRASAPPRRVAVDETRSANEREGRRLCGEALRGFRRQARGEGPAPVQLLQPRLRQRPAGVPAGPEDPEGPGGRAPCRAAATICWTSRQAASPCGTCPQERSTTREDRRGAEVPHAALAPSPGW